MKDIFYSFIRRRQKSLILEIDQMIQANREFMRAKMIQLLRNYLTPLPFHYVWEDDGCPWDRSGRLVDDGLVSTAQTVSSFLENEYLPGQSYGQRAYGYDFRTYGEEFADAALDLAEMTVYAVFDRVLAREFGPEYHALNEDERTELLYWAHDLIANETLAFELFFPGEAVKFLDIGDLLLQDLIEA